MAEQTKRQERVADIGKPSSTAFVLGLFKSVLEGDLGMTVAEGDLREYLNSLPEEEQAALKENWSQLARKIMQVAEGFSQALTVAGSRQ
jgi:hypothetical protein